MPDFLSREPKLLLTSICQHLSSYNTHWFQAAACCQFGLFYTLVKLCYKVLGLDLKPALVALYALKSIKNLCLRSKIFFSVNILCKLFNITL